MRRINYKSDIPPLLLSLKVDENQITVPDCDFIVRFYIDGYEGRHYDCSHIGGVWSNCEPSEDGTKLVCYINNQRLGIGELCAEFHYIRPDRRYSDGSQKSVVIIGSTELGVELVEDNGDAVTEAAIDVTLPFIYRTAYEIARDHGYTGTAEDFYGALASVVGIADAEKKRVTAEITRNANEQERIENEENRLNAESERVNAEAQRVRNEAIRGDAESDRVEQEEDRKAKFEEITGFIATVRANEGNRESNERERQTNEDTRITEEAKRVDAEKKRAAEFEQQKLDLAGKIDRSGDEMGGDLIFTDNAGVTFSTSDGGAHTMFNDTDDVAKFTSDNGDTFEFKQNETPNKNSSAVVVSKNLYNALDMTLESMGSALDGDAAYHAEAGDKIFNPDTCKIQIYNSTIGGFEDLCDPIDGKLYANKMTGYIYRWDTKTKKMVFVGGVKAYTKDEADSRFAKLDDATQIVKVKELEANNSVTTKSMWIGDEGLLLGGDGNGHLTVEQDEVITDVTLNEKLATKADDVAYGVEWNNGQPTGNMQETTVKEATKNTTVATLFLGQSCNALETEVEKKADKTELDTIKANVDQKVGKTDITQSTGTSETTVMSQKAVSDSIAVEETRAKKAEENLDNKVTDLEARMIYDVSANNDGAVFDSIQSLLSSSDLDTLIPISVRHGGMMIRFIQSPNNRYVEYRLMTTSFSINEEDWQGVDSEPIFGSENIVESGGVKESIEQISDEVGKLALTKEYVNPSDFSGLIIDDSRKVVKANSIFNSFIIRVAKGTVFSFNRIIEAYKLSNYPKLGETIPSDVNFTYLANKDYTALDTMYLLIQGRVSSFENVTITTKPYGLKNDIAQLKSGLNNITNSVVKCTAQEFSEDEKSIARNNIDASKKKTVDTYIEQEQTAIMQGNYAQTDLGEVIPKGSIITSISENILSFYPYNSNLTLDTSVLINSNVLPYTLLDDCYGIASKLSGNLIIGYSKLISTELNEYLEEEVSKIKEDISNIKKEVSLTNTLFKNKKIAVFGDSITHMTGSDGKSYSDWIAKYTGADVVNFGIGGATIRQRSTPSLDPASAEQEAPPRNVFDVAFSSLDVVNMVKAFVTGDTSYQEAAKQWANNNPSAEGASTIIGQIDSIDRLIASDIKDFDAIIIMAGTNDFWNTGTTFIDEPTGNLGYTGEAIKEIIKDIKSYSNKEIAIYWFTPIVRFCDPYPFDIYTNYQEGDRVTYNNKRYEFNIEHPAGTWIGTDVTEITIEESHDIKGWGSNFKNRNKITLEEFSNRLFNLVKSQNIDICDMYHDLGWTFWNFKRFCGPTDRTHPYYGLQYIGRKISSWIISHKTVL